MGLLDMLLGKATGGGAGSGNTEAMLVNALVAMLGNKESGGLSGIVDAFTKNGMGDIVSSWVSTGKNLPISPDQITKGLGNDQISQLASQLGLSSSTVSSMLSKALPNIVDKLTPNGQVPTEDLLAKGLDLLKGMKF